MSDHAREDDGAVDAWNRLDGRRGHGPLQKGAQILDVKLDDDVDELGAPLVVGQPDLGDAGLETGDQDRRGIVADGLHAGDGRLGVVGRRDIALGSHLHLLRGADGDGQGRGTWPARRVARWRQRLLRHKGAAEHKAQQGTPENGTSNGFRVVHPFTSLRSGGWVGWPPDLYLTCG